MCGYSITIEAGLEHSSQNLAAFRRRWWQLRVESCFMHLSGSSEFVIQGFCCSGRGRMCPTKEVAAFRGPGCRPVLSSYVDTQKGPRNRGTFKCRFSVMQFKYP